MNQTLTQPEPVTSTQTGQRYAVFFQSERLHVGLADRTTYEFETENAAYRFIFDKLVEAGDIVVAKDNAMTVGGDVCQDMREAVLEAQVDFTLLEYFNVYPLYRVGDGEVLHPTFVEEVHD